MRRTQSSFEFPSVKDCKEALCDYHEDVLSLAKKLFFLEALGRMDLGTHFASGISWLAQEEQEVSEAVFQELLAELFQVAQCEGSHCQPFL